MWDEMEVKVENVVVEKFDFEFVLEIECVYCIGCFRRYDGILKLRMVVCKFISYKVKEVIFKKVRRIKFEDLNIFEDLVEEIMEERSQGIIVFV